MIRTLSLAAVLAALVVAPASAREIRVSVAGKDAATLHHEIWQAARQVCFAELNGSALIFELEAPCAERAVKAAEAQLATANKQVAVNTVPAAR
jgi:UrcA family protein